MNLLYKNIMDVLTKWQLKQTLSEEEAISVLVELYEGANKTFVFDASTKINSKLYDLFEKFPATKYEYVLRFSEQICPTPFVSLNSFDTISPQHTIPTEDFVIYVY